MLFHCRYHQVQKNMANLTELVMDIVINKINNIIQYQWHITSLRHFIQMHILYRLAHSNKCLLDTLHEFSTAVKCKNRWMKERKMNGGHYDMKKNMCSLLRTARTSSLWPSWPALCTACTHIHMHTTKCNSLKLLISKISKKRNHHHHQCFNASKAMMIIL